MRLSIPLGDICHKPLGQVIQGSEVADAQSLPLENAKPSLHLRLFRGESMGITMEMYAADPEEFVSLQKRLASELTSEEEGNLIFNQFRDYPQADFPLHLHWPEDIDALCQAMIAEGVAAPPSHSDLRHHPDYCVKAQTTGKGSSVNSEQDHSRTHLVLNGLL
jgi:hypothetical protein